MAQNSPSANHLSSIGKAGVEDVVIFPIWDHIANPRVESCDGWCDLNRPNLKLRTLSIEGDPSHTEIKRLGSKKHLDPHDVSRALEQFKEHTGSNGSHADVVLVVLDGRDGVD